MGQIRDDEHGTTIGAELDAFNCVISKPGPFIGGTADARGDHDGASDPTTIFNVTGDVLVRCFAVCTTTIVGAGSIELGVAGNTASLIAQIADATDLIAGEIWADATPTDLKVIALSDIPATSVVTNGSNIIETLGTANLTAGEIYYVCLWRALSPQSKVEAA